MPDFRAWVRKEISVRNLPSRREEKIVGELASHLEDVYGSIVDEGFSADEARKELRVRTPPVAELLDEILAAEPQVMRLGRNFVQLPLVLGDLLLAGARRTIRFVVSVDSKSLAKCKREVRQVNISDLLDTVSRDLRYALRRLSRRPAFSFVVIFTLALGIGATTAIFSVVYSVLIKPLPYPDSDELVRIRHSTENIQNLQASWPMYATYRNENETLSDIGLWRQDSATLTERGAPARVIALRVTDGTLQALGVQPMLGRWFNEQEYGPATQGSSPVILSFAFWQQRFGGDEAALGREFSIDSESAAVIGVMPRDFQFLDMTPTPDVILTERLELADPSWFRYQMLARLEPGATLAEARTDVDRMLSIWLAPVPNEVRAAYGQFTTSVRPLKDDLVGSITSTLWVLMISVGAVLLIACANIANLMLVRTEARKEELSMRAALGAMPGRIARELLVESLVLGVAGGMLGLLLAYISLQVLVAIGPSNLPRLDEISVYSPVLAFTVAVSLVSTLLFGSIGALKHARRIDAPVFSAGRASASRERNATRSALVVIQVALALVLVVSAALMIRSFLYLRDIDPGFSDPETIQTAEIWVSWPNPDPAESLQWTRTQHEISDRIAAIPGVDSVGFVNSLPFDSPGTRNSDGYAVEGMAVAPGDRPPQAQYKYVSPGYFDAMGTRIIAGREMTWRDIDAGGRVAVISEAFARELAPEPAGALGQRIRRASDEEGAWREVIGVTQNIHEAGLYEEPSNMVYWPVFMENTYEYPELGTPIVTFAIRSERTDTSSFVEEIRQAVWSVTPSTPVAQERTMQDLYADSLARTSFTLVMLAIAGGLALALGIVGIYAVIAYVVSQRTREIGIRSALGAEPRKLTRMFLLHGLTLGAVGVTAGVGAAAALGHLMSSLLFGIDPLDPTAYIAALGVILVAAALASYLPARRAAAIDPMLTLRAE
jgi:predicted permease